MNAIETFKKYSKTEWTEEQKDIISDAFNKLDRLLLSCQQERNIEKIKEIKDAHKIMHDINLTISLKRFMKEDEDNSL